MFYLCKAKGAELTLSRRLLNGMITLNTQSSRQQRRQGEGTMQGGLSQSLHHLYWCQNGWSSCDGAESCQRVTMTVTWMDGWRLETSDGAAEDGGGGGLGDVGGGGRCGPWSLLGDE